MSLIWCKIAGVSISETSWEVTQSLALPHWPPVINLSTSFFRRKKQAASLPWLLLLAPSFHSITLQNMSELEPIDLVILGLSRRTSEDQVLKYVQLVLKI